MVKRYLLDHDITFFEEYKFQDCKDINPLPFDFYLPDKNICIEFDGKQHYQAIKAWDGEEGLIYTQYHDNIKTQYCINHNIKLIRIPYWDKNNIDNILQNTL